VALSLLLVAVFVSHRGGAFRWLGRISERQGEAEIDVVDEEPQQTAEAADTVMFASSKSGTITGPVAVPADEPPPAVMGGSKSNIFFAPRYQNPDVIDPGFIWFTLKLALEPTDGK
jgi:hypothetical protein